MKMSSMKLSVIISLGGRWTKSGSAVPNCVLSWVRHGVVSRKLNLEVRFEVFHVGSKARSHARSVAPSLMMLKSVGAGEDPNGSLVRR